MEIILTHRFNMGHTLHRHPGACARLHGHNYRLELTVASDAGLDNQGMVMDFGELRRIVRGVVDERYDHQFLIEMGDPRLTHSGLTEDDGLVVCDRPPTAENLAGYLAGHLSPAIAAARWGLRLTRLVLWETDDCAAVWTPA